MKMYKFNVVAVVGIVYLMVYETPYISILWFIIFIYTLLDLVLED